MTPAAVLYVGAGVDIPLIHIPSYHRLVCVDCQPFSESGLSQCDFHANTNCFLRMRFLEELNRSAKRIGLDVHDTNSNVVRRYGSRVRYYTSTAIPDHIERLQPEGLFSTLLVRGHDPHENVLDLLHPTDNTFIGFTGTVYSKEESDTVIYRLNICESTRARFKMFTLVQGTTRIHCNDWFDFVRHAHDSPPKCHCTTLW